MIAIFYENDAGKGILKKFETRMEALNFAIEEKLDPERTEVFEVARSLQICFALVNAPKEEKTPDDLEKRNELLPQRYCDKCKVAKIAHWNKSGLCRKCGLAAVNLKIKQKKDKKRADKPTKISKIEKDNSKRIIEENKERSKTTAGRPDKGTCVKCENKFKLKDWQAVSIHWCPECRKIPGYKGPLEGLY